MPFKDPEAAKIWRREWDRKRYHADLEKSRAANCERKKSQYARDPEAIKAAVKRYKAKNPEKVAATHKAWVVENRERVREIKNKHAAKPEVKVLRVGIRARYVAKRRGATVGWDAELTDLSFDEAVRLCRAREKLTGIKWHVDHFYPLAGVDVCGLHTWANFRVIPATVNCAKQNKTPAESDFFQLFTATPVKERYGDQAHPMPQVQRTHETG